MARTTTIVSDQLWLDALGADASVTMAETTAALEIRIGDEVVRIHVPAEQAHAIAAAIAADLLAALPVIGDPA